MPAFCLLLHLQNLLQDVKHTQAGVEQLQLEVDTVEPPSVNLKPSTAEPHLITLPACSIQATQLKKSIKHTHVRATQGMLCVYPRCVFKTSATHDCLTRDMLQRGTTLHGLAYGK